MGGTVQVIMPKLCTKFETIPSAEKSVTKQFQFITHKKCKLIHFSGMILQDQQSRNKQSQK